MVFEIHHSRDCFDGKRRVSQQFFCPMHTELEKILVRRETGIFTEYLEQVGIFDSYFFGYLFCFNAGVKIELHHGSGGLNEFVIGIRYMRTDFGGVYMCEKKEHQSSEANLKTGSLVTAQLHDLLKIADDFLVEADMIDRFLRVEQLVSEQPVCMSSGEANPVFFPSGFRMRLVGMPYTRKKDENIAGFNFPLAVQFVVENSASGGDVDDLVLAEDATMYHPGGVELWVLARIWRVFGARHDMGITCIITINFPFEGFFVDGKIARKTLAVTGHA